ncbi:MAG: hypothetical protein NTY23_13140 [Chloroflexi bacterium]|jgi:hypothetical protein|nr:hypothetical protein [Chloroflexota bacterium]
MISTMLSLTDMQVLIALTVMGAGLCSLAAGIIVLASRGFSKEMRVLAAQSAKLSEKGMSHDMADVVSGAAEILGLLNQLTRTSTGVGMFLMAAGIGLIGAAYYVVMQIQWPLA